MATNNAQLDILLKRRLADSQAGSSMDGVTLKSGELAMNEVGQASNSVTYVGAAETLYYGISTAGGVVPRAIAGRGAFLALDSTSQTVSGTKTFLDVRVPEQTTWASVAASDSLVTKAAVEDKLTTLSNNTGSSLTSSITGLSATVDALVKQVSGDLYTTFSQASGDLATRISNLSGSVDSLVSEVSGNLHQEIVSLSGVLFGTATPDAGLDTISDIGVAVKSLQDYNTGNHFLSASGPEITAGDLKLASGAGIKYSDGVAFVDGSKNVNVASLSATGNANIDGNLTVVGNLSVLGDVTYLDTQVTTMSAVVATLQSDSATTLDVKQTGSFDIASFGNSSGTQLSISNSGSLSAKQAATFDSTVAVKDSLTVTNSISSGTTVYGKDGVFHDTLEVGAGNTAVLFANADGVGINTENLGGYSLNVANAGAGLGSMYVGGSATFVGQVEIPVSTAVISGQTISSGGEQAVNVSTLWSFISSLDGGSF